MEVTLRCGEEEKRSYDTKLNLLQTLLTIHPTVLGTILKKETISLYSKISKHLRSIYMHNHTKLDFMS